MGKENLNNRLVLSQEEPEGAGERPAGSFSLEQEREEIARGNQVLLGMFEVIKRSTYKSNRECFNQLVRFLADCARVHPMPEADHWVADRLLPLVEDYIEACSERPYDYLGDLFTAKECANESLGQIITPPWLVAYINKSTIGQIEDDERWKLVLDPCVGTGRFLVDAAIRFRDRKLALYGVELDIDLYRACFVNMRFFAWGLPYFILRANALMVDLRPESPNWRFANLWDPPNWDTGMLMEEGITFEEFRRKHGEVVSPPSLPQEGGEQSATGVEGEGPQPRFFERGKG